MNFCSLELVYLLQPRRLAPPARYRFCCLLCLFSCQLNDNMDIIIYYVTDL